ncbi:MAG: hypothetical protein ABSB00_00295 [Minisyncoccia bacterium]
MNDEEKQEVFRGHFEECLEHFGMSFNSRIPKGTRRATQVKKPIADFCGVTIHSVTRWLHNTGMFPIGEELIKLMCFLDMNGYRIIELERMPKVRRNFAELVGYGLLSGEQATILLGYASSSQLYEILRGDWNASEEKGQKMWNEWKRRKEELEKRKSGYKILQKGEG